MIARWPSRRVRSAALVALLLAVVAGLFIARHGGSSLAGACLPWTVRQQAAKAAEEAGDGPRVPRLAHVVLIVMENRECSQVLGSSQAPYFNSLGRHAAVLPAFYATTHPSLPNYLSLTAGTTLGTNDSCSRCIFHVRNLVDELATAHLSWRAYMEGMPSACYSGARFGSYARRHNPFVMYADVSGDPSRCSNIVPLTRLWDDIRRGRVPAFAWITPDLCHDMHDCDVRHGDDFLATVMPPLVRAVGPRGAVFVTWDEGTTKRGCCRLAHGGNIPALVAGGAVHSGARPIKAYDSYSILRTIDDALGLPRLGGAACRCTPGLGEIFRGA